MRVLESVVIGLFACSITSCGEQPIFAPRDAELVVQVVGVPDDPGITVTAYIENLHPPFNRDTEIVSLGGSAHYRNLGAGFDIRVALEDLDTHRCRAVRIENRIVTIFDTVATIVTTNEAAVDTVLFRLRCQSATLMIDVRGLPANDSAVLIVPRGDPHPGPVEAVPILFDTLRVNNGTLTLGAIPRSSAGLIPQPVIASDGSRYEAAASSVTLISRDTTSAVVFYSVASACPQQNPIAWYRLDGGSAADASGNGNDGTVHGAVAVQDRTSAPGAALAFDGVDDRIDLADRFNTLELPFSVAAWVFQPAAARGDLRSIFATDDELGRYAGIWFQTNAAGLLSITYADGGGVGAQSRRTSETTSPLAGDAWVHVAATVRGPTDMTLYVNGDSVAATFNGSGGPIAHTAAPARIGSFSLVEANRPWLGRLDDVRIYDCNLNASEVAQLFNTN